MSTWNGLIIYYLLFEVIGLFREVEIVNCACASERRCIASEVYKSQIFDCWEASLRSKWSQTTPGRFNTEEGEDSSTVCIVSQMCCWSPCSQKHLFQHQSSPKENIFVRHVIAKMPATARLKSPSRRENNGHPDVRHRFLLRTGDDSRHQQVSQG